MTLATFNKNYHAVVVYTSSSDQNLHAVSIQHDLSINKMAPITLPQNLQIRLMKCKDIMSATSCVIINNGNLITDITLDYQSIAKTLKVTSTRTYFNYQDFYPTSFDFNDELLVTKCSNKKSELMLVYQRSQTGDNNIWWGLRTSEYYNVRGANMTKSLPLVFRNRQGRTVLRFTQNQMVGTQDQPSPIFKGYKAETSLLVLNTNITQSNAEEVGIEFTQFGGENQIVPISKFLDGSPNPGPDDKGSGWEFWIVVIVVFILAGLVSYFIITKFKGENDTVSAGDDYHYGYTPTENLTVTKYDFDADEVNLGSKLSNYEKEEQEEIDVPAEPKLELRQSYNEGTSRFDSQSESGQGKDAGVASD